MLQVSKLIPQGQGLAQVLVRRAAQLELDWDVRQKSRFDATASDGRQVGVFLPRGTVVRGGTTAQVSGDVDGGDLTLEESINGTNISATWTGQVVDGSCGKEIRGTWNNAHPTPTTPSAPFVLRKQAAWQ